MPWVTPPGAGATVYIWNGYSLAERDRRWNAVRANAAKAGLDCIMIPLGNGTDARYMTQLRCSAMVLPSDGRAPIVIADRKSNNEWVPEPWQTGREWAEPMGEALLDLGMDKARVGVVGLKGGSVTHCNSIDGVVNHTAFAHVMGKVPNAIFTDATEIVGAVRFVKSAEELEFVHRSAQVASAGLDELIRLARPGVDAGVFYSALLAKMLELRSEYFPLTLTIDHVDSVKPKRYSNPPIGRRLEADALITSEIHAIMGAQLTQICQPILLGKIADAWNMLIAVQREVYEAGLQMIKPGVSYGALEDFVTGFGAKRGVKTILQLHGCGYGDDGPLFMEKLRNPRARELTMQKNNALVWKPMAQSADGTRRFACGGPLIVTENGCESLFDREPGLLSII
ncbi:MAG TPA: M24 family metallopeptidase [Candidatus Binatus sp.]|nr:M24 family metallopeptidase [Candidatus Binatus sp.]